jgi:hypothetical protein
MLKQTTFLRNRFVPVHYQEQVRYNFAQIYKIVSKKSDLDPKHYLAKPEKFWVRPYQIRIHDQNTVAQAATAVGYYGTINARATAKCETK